MSTKRPITVSFPLGLFCAATLSTNPPKSPEEKPETPVKGEKTEEASGSEEKEPPTPPLGGNGLRDDLYWDDGSA